MGLVALQHNKLAISVTNVIKCTFALCTESDLFKINRYVNLTFLKVRKAKKNLDDTSRNYFV